MDLKNLVSFTDYFIICTASSARMLDALADGVVEKTLLGHKKKAHVEGLSASGWIVLDYGDIVVHLFSEEMRRFYKLEELWSKGKTVLRLQ
jgi:ribosome-associated protein